MSAASDKLARSRLAIVEHIARRQRRHDPREEQAGPTRPGFADLLGDEPPPEPGSGWFGHLSPAVRTWWRYHPAHMAVDLASPLLRIFASFKTIDCAALALFQTFRGCKVSVRTKPATFAASGVSKTFASY